MGTNVLSSDVIPGIEVAVATFQSELRGSLIRPGDVDYDEARSIWNAMIERRPALIARCAGVADVISAVNFARENKLPVAVRAGGHNVAGTALCDNGLVIDLTRMKGIRVDPIARTARVEGGVTWGELDQETQVFGLATTGGVIPSTGVAGLTLGGGIGWMMRSCGLSCDNLLAADVVTADGKFHRASATENADLLWGLKGGGGNFGVVTSLEFQLHEIGPMVVAGPLFHPIDTGIAALSFARDQAATQPDSLVCHVGFVTGPDGNAQAVMIPAYFGPLDEADDVLGPWRSFGPPVVDMLRPMPYRTLQSLFNADYPDGRRNYWKSAFLPALPDEAIQLMIAEYHRAPSPYSTILLEQVGGAVNRVAPGDTAFPHRSGAYNLILTSAWEDSRDDDANIAWVREVWTTILPYIGDGVYVNYLSDLRYEGEQRIRAAYGPNYDRLVALKQKFDPTNLFHANQNISPNGA